MRKKEEIRARIREIGSEIQEKIERVTHFEDSESGRGGTRCYIPTGKKGIEIEVIGYLNKDPYRYMISLAIKKSAAIINGGNADKVRQLLRQKIMEAKDQLDNFVGERDKRFNRKNPRICEYSLRNFETIWRLFQDEELGLQDSQNWWATLFRRDYSFEKVIKRYRYAIKEEDQVLLNLSRVLLEADAMDHLISVNWKVSPYSYREHVVPCIKIHQLLIQKIREGRANDSELVCLLKRHLKIVHIHTKEAEILNSSYRTEMPPNWTSEESPYARLINCGIKVRNVKGDLCLRNEAWNGQALSVQND